MNSSLSLLWFLFEFEIKYAFTRNASRFVVLDEIYPRPPGTMLGMGVTMQKRLSRHQ